MYRAVRRRHSAVLVVLGCVLFLSASCTAGTSDGVAGEDEIVVDTSFLADITRNIAGDRITVSSLVPLGTEPHSFEPTPRDAEKLEVCRAIVINVKGLIPILDDLVFGAGGPEKPVIEAAAGLSGNGDDPHYWLDPNFVVDYVENIAEGLSQLDPGGEETYRANADAYVEDLRSLDSWIKEKVATIPAEERLLVTNHESLGWFAERYGFQIVGSVFPTTGGEGSPSAREVARLIERIQETGARAVFVESGSNADLAEQVGAEAGVQVITDLYTHSLLEGASDYIQMMRWNVEKIVEALR